MLYDVRKGSTVDSGLKMKVINSDYRSTGVITASTCCFIYTLLFLGKHLGGKDSSSTTLSNEFNSKIKYKSRYPLLVSHSNTNLVSCMAKQMRDLVLLSLPNFTVSLK